MTHYAPDTRPRYGPTQSPGVAPMGGGWLVTCECSWLRWWNDLADAQRGRKAHAKKCKAVSDE